MELTLTRQELLQVSSTCRKTMRLLPLGKKKQQKVVVGDETGTVQCFGMKKDGVVETIFKTPTGEREVGRIEVAGAGGKSDASGEEPVKIFFASGGTVRGLLRKGKEFLRFNTNLTEPIRSMYVQDDHIFTGGEYIFNHFYQLKDTAFFMSNDRINDLTAEFVTGGSRAEAVLACQDRMIRVLTGSDLLYEVSIDGPAVTIERYHNPVPSAGAPSQGFGPSSPGAAHVQNDGRFKELLYGTENGLIGQLLLDASMMRRGWVVDPALEGRRGKVRVRVRVSPNLHPNPNPPRQSVPLTRSPPTWKQAVVQEEVVLAPLATRSPLISPRSPLISPRSPLASPRSPRSPVLLGVSAVAGSRPWGSLLIRPLLWGSRGLGGALGRGSTCTSGGAAGSPGSG